MEYVQIIGSNLDTRNRVPATAPHVESLACGGQGHPFRYRGAARMLPLKADWGKRCPGWSKGRLHTMALALTQAMGTCEPHRRAGLDCLRAAAEQQVARGADALLVNVDALREGDRAAAMAWAVDFLQQAYGQPLVLEAAAPETVGAGLAALALATPVLVRCSGADEALCAAVAARGPGGFLTLYASVDEPPETAAARAAEQLEALGARGIRPEQIWLDIPVGDSARVDAACETLRLCRERLSSLRRSARLRGAAADRLEALAAAGLNAAILDPLAAAPSASVRSAGQTAAVQ